MKLVGNWLLSPDEPVRVSPEVARSFLPLAWMNRYLNIGIDQSSVELLHSAERRRRRELCITLKKCDRWYWLNVHLFGDVLTDDARNQVFNLLLIASLPGGLVRASNRTVTATQVPFRVGAELVQWLAAFVFESDNREKGAGREHARCEG